MILSRLPSATEAMALTGMATSLWPEMAIAEEHMRPRVTVQPSTGTVRYSVAGLLGRPYASSNPSSRDRVTASLREEAPSLR